MSDPWADVDDSAKEYKPQPAQRPGPEVLPEGLYACEVLEACFKMVTMNNAPKAIFIIDYRVTEGDWEDTVIQSPCFFNKGDADRLGGVFVTLGIEDAKLWGQRGNRWSAECNAAAPSLIGRRCMCQRKDDIIPANPPKYPNEKTLCKWLVISRIDDKGRGKNGKAPPPVPPPVQSPAWRSNVQPAPAPTSNALPVGAISGQSDDDIPF